MNVEEELKIINKLNQAKKNEIPFLFNLIIRTFEKKEILSFVQNNNLKPKIQELFSQKLAEKKEYHEDIIILQCLNDDYFSNKSKFIDFGYNDELLRIQYLLAKDSNFFDKIEIKDIKGLNSLNINRFYKTNNDCIIDFLISVIKSKKTEDEKISNFNSLISFFLESLFRYMTVCTGYKKNEKITLLEEFSNFIIENDLSYLFYKIDLNSYQMKTKDNISFLLLIFGNIEAKKKDNNYHCSILYDLYERQKSNIDLKIKQIIDLELFISSFDNDCVFHEFFIDSLRKKEFYKGTVFYISNGYYNLKTYKEILLNGYYIKNANPNVLFELDLDLLDYFKQFCHDKLIRLETINKIDLILISKFIKDKTVVEKFLYEYSNIIFDKKLRIKKEGIEFLELNFQK